ncbi:MAG: NYN domain-containing protein [Gaiellales bacterium]
MASTSVVLVLVDGSNVARCSVWRRYAGPDASDHELRRRLIDVICSWSAHGGHQTCVTFDGAGPWRAGSTRITKQVEVVGSGPREGDDIIEQRAAIARGKRQLHWIVTSDVALRRVAGMGADRVLDSDGFAHELLTPDPMQAMPSAPDAADRGGRSQLGAGLDPKVRARLEQLRRGLK